VHHVGSFVWSLFIWLVLVMGKVTPENGLH